MLRRFFLLFLLVGWCAYVWTAIPAGYYYFAANKKKAELKTALKTYGSPVYVLEYGSGKGYTWQGFYATDNHNDTVRDMYSDVVRTFDGFNSVSGMHIEHSLPKSWWGGATNKAYKDLFHLYPADGTTNTTKSNLPLGEVAGNLLLDNGVSKIGRNGFESDYTGNCFEPADEYKGDFARSYLYMSTIYEDFASLWQSPMMDNNTWPVWKPWAISLLLKWHHQDPVSDKERDRLEAVYNIQGNRNPFIDYPELADYIWGTDTTAVFPFPAETQPFIITPHKGIKLDFGYMMNNSTRSQTLHIQSANLLQSIQLTNKKSVFTLSTNTLSATQSTSGTDITISFSPIATGEYTDTLYISGNELAEITKIPLVGNAIEELLVLPATDLTPVGATLHWIADPLATGYTLTLNENTQQAGDLIISAYAEGSSWNKAIELYNGSTRSIDLSKYALQKQSNGTGKFGNTLQLSGTLSPNSTYVIVHKSASQSLLSKATLVADSVLQFNGNDAIRLIHSGLVIDMVGIADDELGTIWGQDVTLQRIPDVNFPSATYNTAEWKHLPNDSIAFLGLHQMTFSPISGTERKINVGNTNSYPVENLSPNSKLTYTVESTRPDGTLKAANTMQIITSQLDTPEPVPATQVSSTGFMANWETTPYASHYLLDVYTLTGSGQVTETEGFPLVGTGGTPLPDGWTGNASGNYTSTASSGNATPSVALKNEGEWLQTKTYPHTVSSLSFMYRFASTATASSLAVYGLNNGIRSRIDSIVYVNSTKTTATYHLTPEQNFTAFRFIYHKLASSNLAIDDVAATYGTSDTLFIEKNKTIYANSFEISGLTPATSYFYRVRAASGSSASAYSVPELVTTSVQTGTHQGTNSTISYRIDNQTLYLTGLSGSERISLYTLTGMCINRITNIGGAVELPLMGKGIYILHISKKGMPQVFKIVSKN
ncbi:MAG: nuclease [Bacteroidetes bacterium]|nr:nuclease [Bacteroidota bacterium]